MRFPAGHPSGAEPNALLAWGMILVLGVLVVLVLRTGAANLFHRQAYHELAGLTVHSAPSDRDRVRRHLQRALSLSDADPNVLENLAQYHVRQAAAAGNGIKREASLEQALQLLTAAARLRPVSPYTWANIANLKYHLRQQDAQFRAAIRNAALLGATTQEVQRIIADIGLGTWSTLDAETRAAVQTVLRQAVKP